MVEIVEIFVFFVDTETGETETRRVLASSRDDLLAQVKAQRLSTEAFVPREMRTVDTDRQVWSDKLPGGWVEEEPAIFD